MTKEKSKQVPIGHTRCASSVCPFPRSISEIRRNRPVVTATPQPDNIDSEPIPTTDQKPKDKRAKRACEADIRRAVKLVFDENVTQKEAEIMCNLPLGTLSRRKGKQIMEQYLKEWGKPTRIDVPPKVNRKEAENAFQYGEN